MTGAQLERLLWHMPVVFERASDEWVRVFAKSIMRQSSRRGWKPSSKQLNTMRRLVSDLFSHPTEKQEEGINLIE